MEKQKLNEELSRIREIMSITLKESNSSLKKNIELDIEERVAGKNIGNIVDLANDFQSLNPLYKGMFDDLESAIKLQQNPIKIVDKTTKKVTNLNTSEDIFNAIKNNSLTSTELGRVEKGFLKSTNTPKPLRKSIVVDFVIDPAVLKDLGKVPGGKTNDIKKYLKSKGYADDSINEIITQLKSNGKIDKSGNFVGSVKPKPVDPNNPDPNNPNPNNPNPKPNDPSWWEKLKTIGWKKALLAAGVAGVSGLLLWYLFKQEGTNPEDMEETPPIDPNNEWAPCLSNILSKKQGRVDKLKSGTLVVKVKNTTYPDGVLFFADGKVLTNDGKKKGTWKCKSGTAVVSEQSTGNNLSIDAESVVNSLKGNVITTMGLESVQNILNKYIKSGQGKQFLDVYKKISGEFLENTLISKTTIKDPSKSAIRDRIYGKIRTIKGSGGTSTGDSLSGIEITWDDEKKKENTGGGEVTYYKDCSSFPLYLGCKGPLVSELQTCLKMTGVDGKLGPKTKATAETWAKSKGITLTIPTAGSGGNVDGQVVFGVTEDNFKRICGVEPVPVRIEPDPEPVANVDGPVVNPTTIPEKPTNSDVRKKSDEELGWKLYTQLKKAGLLSERDGIFGGPRIVYKGSDLSEENKRLLTIFMNTKDYVLTDDKEKKEGEKLVYKKIKR
jgi:hypothetical protein